MIRSLEEHWAELSGKRWFRGKESAMPADFGLIFEGVGLSVFRVAGQLVVSHSPPNLLAEKLELRSIDPEYTSTKLLALPLRELVFDQSNSALLLGEQFFVKLYHYPKPSAESVELEVNLHLHTHHFQSSPKLVAVLESEWGLLGLVFELVLGGTSLWDLALQNTQQLDESLEELGHKTALLHQTLSLEGVGFAVSKANPTYFGELEANLENFQDERTEKTKTFALSLLEKSKADKHTLIRVHGDYHLGQVLKSANNSLWLIDFEGEPLASTAQRRTKSSPLRDLAGMLRSLDYLVQLTEQTSKLPRWREVFLEAYFRTIPSALAHFEKDLLLFFEITKALYELEYEKIYRPSYAKIPLNYLQKISEGDLK